MCVCVTQESECVLCVALVSSLFNLSEYQSLSVSHTSTSVHTHTHTQSVFSCQRSVETAALVIIFFEPMVLPQAQTHTHMRSWGLTTGFNTYTLTAGGSVEFSTSETLQGSKNKLKNSKQFAFLAHLSALSKRCFLSWHVTNSSKLELHLKTC